MLCVLFFCVFLWEKEQLRNSLGSFFSHRTHSFNRTFQPTFRTHRRPPAYRIHRTLLLKVAVRFCEIGWLNVSVECCVFCSSVFFCERKKVIIERQNTNYINRECQDILQRASFSFRERAEFGTRRGPSPFENMPFSVQEGRLLHARRACPQTLFVICWFQKRYVSNNRE